MRIPSPRLVRLIVSGTAIAVLLWALVVAAAAWSARGGLVTAEAALVAAQQRLREGDVTGAGQDLQRAADAAASAHDRLDTVVVGAAGALPGLGNSVEVVTALASATRDVTAAARDVVGRVEGLPEGVASLLPRDGALPVESLASLAAPLAALDRTLASASQAVAATPTSLLVPSVADGRARFGGLADGLRDQVSPAADLAASLPTFLGGDGPRRYFLAVANPAELRAVGGFIGAFALLTIDGGRIDVGSFGPTWDLPSLPPGRVEPPDPSFAARYDRYNATGLWSNTNLSPDFPTVATAIERLWAATEDRPVDGTILVDPFALEALLRLTGPVEVPETGVVMRPATVVDYVANGSFDDLVDPRERKEVIGDVAAASLAAFLDGDTDAPLPRLVRTLGDAMAQRHLILHAADAAEQAALARVGATGPLEDPDRGSFLAVTYNSGTASKVDFWLDEELRQHVRLLEDGRAEVTTTISLHNGAPTTGVGRVVGPNTPGLEAGGNRLMVNLYCGSRCELLAASGDSGERMALDTELGRPVASGWTTIPSGERAVLDVTYLVDGAWESEQGHLVLPFRHHDQTMVREGTLEVVVEIPDGFRAGTLPDGASVEAGQLRWRRTGRGDVDLRFTLDPES